jgi:hypothetical protein
LIVNTAATPDTFKISLDQGTTWSSAHNVSTTAEDLGFGLGARWAATTGHTATDYWRIVNVPDAIYDGAQAGAISLYRVDLDGNDTLTSAAVSQVIIAFER